MAANALRIAVLGAGRMGREVCDVIDTKGECELAGVWSRSADCELATLLGNADVAIDFTLPGATAEVLRTAAATGTPLVCGVTGLDSEAEQLLDTVAASIAILYERNMSRGIAVMLQLLGPAAQALGSDFRVEIRETHHRHKKDAPSGTAIALREALGDPSIDIHSRREGEVAGDHTVIFSSDSESLTVAHSVARRRVFAEGAVAAACWLHDKPRGRYRMSDIGP